MASCVLSKSCPSRPTHVSLLPFPHLPLCCFRFNSSRPCIFLSCHHLSSSHHLATPCLLKALSLSSPRSFSSHLPAVVTAYDDSGDASRVLGRDPGAVDAGLQSGKVSGSQYFQNIFNSEPRTGGDRFEKNSNAQQPSTLSGSIEHNEIAANITSSSAREPTEYDFEIYASNSMEGWTPPPPPLPPFGNVFEDYWGEVIGEDYLPKKAERSSLLAYLDSLNAAKPDAGNSPTNSVPFRSSNLRRNRPFEGTRANRPIRSENLRASRPIKEPKPIDTSWSADWSEGSYDISREVDKKPSGRPGGTMPVEGDGVGDSRPTQRKIILGNSKLLGPLPGYGVEDAKPAGRNTNFMNGDGARPAERDMSLGDSKSVGPFHGYSDEGGAKFMERNATLGKDHLSNASGRDDPADASTAERNTSFNRSNFSSLVGRDGTLSKPLPGYGAGVAKPAERNTMLEQSNVSRTADGISAGDIKPIERKGIPRNTESLGPLPGHGVGDKPAQWDTHLGRNMENPSEVDAARYPDHEKDLTNSAPTNPNGVSDAKPWGRTTVSGSSSSLNQNLGMGAAPAGSSSLIDARIGDSLANARSDMGRRASSIEKAQLSGSVADYGPVEDMLLSGRSGDIISGGKDVLAAKPDGNISSARHDDKISTVQPMDPAMGPSKSLDSRPLNFIANVEVKLLDSVDDTRGVESGIASKPMEDSTAFTLEGTYVSPDSPSSLAMLAVAAGDGQVSEVVTQLYEPKVRDIVLGAVTSANDQKLDLEIGAELPGLMLSKDLRPFFDINLDSNFFKLPSNDDNDKPEGFAAPIGKSLIVEDKTIYNGAIASGSVVDRGMVIMAEVEGRTLGDGRAILSVRPPARRIAWHRVNQLMQVAEAFDIQITQWNDGGLLSYVEGLRAFLPRSELLQRPESAVSLKEYVGRVLTVSIARVEEEAANIVISELKAWTRKRLRLGTLHDATVSKLYPFGMQVEVNNTRVRGFVHVSNMSKEYVRQVADLFKEGDKVKVMLIRGRDSRQIAFSIADLESDRGLIFRDKERVFREAEEMARRFQESLSADDQQGFGQEMWDTQLEFQEPVIANMNWLHL